MMMEKIYLLALAAALPVTVTFYQDQSKSLVERIRKLEQQNQKSALENVTLKKQAQTENKILSNRLNSSEAGRRLYKSAKLDSGILPFL